jgi:hypothetical protein
VSSDRLINTGRRPVPAGSEMKIGIQIMISRGRIDREFGVDCLHLTQVSNALIPGLKACFQGEGFAFAQKRQ